MSQFTLDSLLLRRSARELTGDVSTLRVLKPHTVQHEREAADHIAQSQRTTVHHITSAAKRIAVTT
jgi:hypothetical protein